MALPSFMMVVNGASDFEVQKSVSIHHKSNPRLLEASYFSF